MYGQETDDEDDDDENATKPHTNGIKKEIDPYEVDTDVDEENIDENDENVELPKLPEFFAEKSFFLYGSFTSESIRKSIIRGIVAGGGKVSNYMQADVDYVITSSDWDSNFKDAREANPEVKFVKPSFVKDCFDQQKIVNDKLHRVSKK